MKSILLLIVVCAKLAIACTTQPLSGKDLMTGKMVTLDPKQAAKGSVIVFLSAKCPCSKSHEPGLEQLAKEFSEFKFVGVHSNADEDEELAGFHFRESGFSFPVIRDEKTKQTGDTWPTTLRLTQNHRGFCCLGARKGTRYPRF